VRFLIDEMFSPDVAEQLRDAGHDAMHVSELSMQAATDGDLLTLATAQARTVVTENASDFLPLLDARIAAGMTVTPVVIALKSNLPRGSGAMSRALATRLDAWAQDVSDPYHYVHWLP
jgi:predicted nuclease of predicted toxin-antitoxin system